VIQKNKEFWGYVGYATSLAGTLLVPPILGLIIGRWLDDKMGTDPLWTMGLFFLGLITGLWSMIKEVTKDS
jgi:F0F1-type ATP synthase assembly protein I